MRYIDFTPSKGDQICNLAMCSHWELNPHPTSTPDRAAPINWATGTRFYCAQYLNHFIHSCLTVLRTGATLSFVYSPSSLFTVLLALSYCLVICSLASLIFCLFLCFLHILWSIAHSWYCINTFQMAKWMQINNLAITIILKLPLVPFIFKCLL